MISLQKKILRPYIFFIVAVPLVIISLFNASIYYFSDIKARQGLEDIYLSLQEKNKNKKPPRIAVFNRAKELSIATELFMFSKQGELTTPDRNQEAKIDNATAKLAFDNLINESFGKIIVYESNNTTYYAMKVKVPASKKPELAIYITNRDFFEPFVAIVNKVLLLITFTVVVIAIIISRKLAISLIKPIKNIIEDIENANFSTPKIVTSKTDIKELFSLSQEVNNMAKRIYEHNQEQKSFLHNASHELRTPLMSIQAYAEGIEQKIFADNNHATNIIKTETKRLSVLVDELLTLSRIENIEQNKSLKHDLRQNNKNSLQKILQTNLESLYAYAIKQNKEIKLKLNNDADVYINEELFYQAVTNIISNAIRFAKATINVTLYTANSTAIIEIEDDGIGIAAKDLPYVFDKFYKGENGNFGLGLSISKSAMHSMNGEISVQNGEKGAIFKLIFPLD